MNWSDFDGKRVALLGAGIENISLVPHLDSAGATIFICDQKDGAVSEELSKDYPAVTLVTGPDHLAKLDQYDVLFRSPGMPISRIEVALKGVNKRPQLCSATDLFLGLSSSIVIGVTGTKGKGTTATMIGDILTSAGKKAVVAGNIGKPIFTIFNELTPETYVVLELSSFQLEDIHHSPHIAVVVPITEEHLKPLSEESPNYHASVNDYVAAKAHITLHQSADDLIIFAADSTEATAIASISKAKKIGVSQSAYQNHWNVGARGEVYRGGEAYLDLASLGLRGQHIFLNATIALAVATELGADKAASETGLKSFRPLPHRLEDCGTVDGVRFVDDSYATAPDATIAALTAFDEPVVLIAGGSSKGADFTLMARKIAEDERVKAVVLIGQEAPRLGQAMRTEATAVAVHDGGASMFEAIKVAKSLAVAGDVVLLSPACASKDMFRNAADRGDQFKQAIHGRPA